MERYTSIKESAQKYKRMLQQVNLFREEWNLQLKRFIIDTGNEVIKQTQLDAIIDVQENIKGLEAITIRLGSKKSGIYQKKAGSDRHDFFKEYGSMVYGQLFNGKVQVWMTFPFIEGLIEPKEPQLIGIFAPPEFSEQLVFNNFEHFFKELIDWEDFDDDNPANRKKIGFGNIKT